MIHTFLLKTATKTWKPSIYACSGGLSFDAQENAAISLPVMMSGEIMPQMLPFGTMSISVQGSGEISPDLDDVPLAALLEFHAGTQRAIALPNNIPVSFQSSLEGYAAPDGYQFARLDVNDFTAVIPARTEQYYTPMLTALFEKDGEVSTYRGDLYHRGDIVYCVVPLTFDMLKVNYFPVYEGYLVQPVKVTTDGLAGVSWSFEFVTNIQRGSPAA